MGPSLIAVPVLAFGGTTHAVASLCGELALCINRRKENVTGIQYTELAGVARIRLLI